METLTNIADPIVTKIRAQIEKITLIFMRLMELSLDRIMHKADIEEFKRSNDAAIAALKTLRLGERVLLSGRMGEIAGSGVFDLSRLFGKGDADHRQFLLAPRFVARIEAIAASKKN